MSTLLRKRLGAALVAACVMAGGAGGLLPLGAHAQSAPNQQEREQAGQQQDRAKVLERKRERMAQREGALREKLKLTAAQEGAWRAYVETMQPKWEQIRPERPDLAKLTAPERMEWMLSRLTEHEQKMRKQLSATKDLYAQFTPEQRRIFDAETANRLGPRRGAHHETCLGKDGMGDQCPMHQARFGGKAESCPHGQHLGDANPPR